MKLTVIVALIVLAGLGIWRFAANKVDFAKPESVAMAFSKALKSNNMSKASQYYVPSRSQEWKTAALAKIESMQGGTFSRFFEEMSDGSPPFVAAAAPLNAPKDETTMNSGTTSLGMKKVDGKWYVSRSPL